MGQKPRVQYQLSALASPQEDGDGQDLCFPTGPLNAKSLLLPTITRSLETSADIWTPGNPGNCIKRAQLLVPRMKAFIKHKMVCEGILSKAQCDSVCLLEPGTHNYVSWVLHERGMWEDESRIIPPTCFACRARLCANIPMHSLHYNMLQHIPNIAMHFYNCFVLRSKAQ